MFHIRPHIFCLFTLLCLIHIHFLSATSKKKKEQPPELPPKPNPATKQQPPPPVPPYPADLATDIPIKYSSGTGDYYQFAPTSIPVTLPTGHYKTSSIDGSDATLGHRYPHLHHTKSPSFDLAYSAPGFREGYLAGYNDLEASSNRNIYGARPICFDRVESPKSEKGTKKKRGKLTKARTMHTEPEKDMELYNLQLTGQRSIYRPVNIQDVTRPRIMTGSQGGYSTCGRNSLSSMIPSSNYFKRSHTSSPRTVLGVSRNYAGVAGGNNFSVEGTPPHDPPPPDVAHHDLMTQLDAVLSKKPVKNCERTTSMTNHNNSFTSSSSYGSAESEKGRVCDISPGSTLHG